MKKRTGQSQDNWFGLFRFDETLDMLPHDLIILKLGKSIADEKTIYMAYPVVNNA